MSDEITFRSLLNHEDIYKWMGAFVSETYKPIQFSNGYWLMQGNTDPAKWLIAAPDGQETHLVHNYREDNSLMVHGAKGNSNKLPRTLPREFFEQMVVDRVVGGSFSDEIAFYSRDLKKEGYDEGYKIGLEEGNKEGYDRGYDDAKEDIKDELKYSLIDLMDEFFDSDLIDKNE